MPHVAASSSVVAGSFTPMKRIKRVRVSEIDRDDGHECAVCKENVTKATSFQSTCSGAHIFHINCALEWGKVQLARATASYGKNGEDAVATMNTTLMPSCPLCRDPVSLALRSATKTTFYLATECRSLLELGSFDTTAKAFKASTTLYVADTPLLSDG